MFLFQESNLENPFDSDEDFENLPLRNKIEILYNLCDFRLDAKDVEPKLIDIESDSLRVEPLGYDKNNSAYWYFYGTRLYREDFIPTSDQKDCEELGNKKKNFNLFLSIKRFKQLIFFRKYNIQTLASYLF